MSDIETKVKEIIANNLPDAGEIKSDSKFIEDLGADSLTLVELVMAFEEEFDVEVPDEDAEKLTSVSEVVKYITSKK